MTFENKTEIFFKSIRFYLEDRRQVWNLGFMEQEEFPDFTKDRLAIC